MALTAHELAAAQKALNEIDGDGDAARWVTLYAERLLAEVDTLEDERDEILVEVEALEGERDALRAEIARLENELADAWAAADEMDDQLLGTFS